jgi:hypothetical protein
VETYVETANRKAKHQGKEQIAYLLITIKPFIFNELYKIIQFIKNTDWDYRLSPIYSHLIFVTPHKAQKLPLSTEIALCSLKQS